MPGKEAPVMATALTSELSALRDEVGRFARSAIATRGDLGRTSQFPWEIWRAMGESGLLGLGFPMEYRGRGTGWLSLAVAGEALVEHGHNPGLALSFELHQIVGRFLIQGFGNKPQRQSYLPRMASGDITGCLAVSEPRTGAHPKYLKTTATRQDDFFSIHGEKTYLTNGPIADVFVVTAITGLKDGKKSLTAFLTPRDTPGLTVTESLALDFLRPSPHGGIKLNGARVSRSNILGMEGRAYEEMIKPFREVEDALLMGPVTGGMARQLELVAELTRKQGITVGDKLKAAAGRLQFLIHEARILTYEAARMLDTPPHPEFLSLLLAGRDLAERFQTTLEEFLHDSGLEPSPELESLTRDLVFTGSIARNVALRKQTAIGGALFARKAHGE